MATHTEPEAVRRETRWTSRLLERFGGTDRRFSDEEVFAALRAGEREGARAADLDGATGVTFPLYCVWKIRYGTLSLSELSARRRHEDRRARLKIGFALAMAGIAAIAVAALLLRGPVERTPGETSEAGAVYAATLDEVAPGTGDPPPEPPTTGSPGAEAPATEPEPPAPAIRPPTGPLVAVSVSADGSVAPIVPLGYLIQVAAAPDEQQARRLAQRLAAAGHPVFVANAFVGDAEVFRVRVGPFDSQQRAEGVAHRLREEGYRSAWIAR